MFQNIAAQFQTGGLDIGDQAHGQARQQPLVDAIQRLGRPVGGDNDPLPECEMPCEGPVGRNDGDCAPSFTLAEGVEGSGNVFGPAAFFADYTCRVILIHIGAEW